MRKKKLEEGNDIISKCETTPETISELRFARGRLMSLAFKNGRLLGAGFLLFLFPPLTIFQRLSFFRKHYYDLETIVNRFAHFTDFLHRK